MFLLTNKQKSIRKKYGNQSPILFCTFSTITAKNKVEIENTIINYFKKKEISFLKISENNGVSALEKIESFNVKITFYKDDKYLLKPKIAFDGIYVGFLIKEDTVTVSISATSIYLDSYSLVKSAENIEHLLTDDNQIDEEQISFSQFLGWKSNLLEEPEIKSTKYWKKLFEDVKNLKSNWIIPLPVNEESNFIFSAENTLPNQVFLKLKENKIEPKEIFRYLWCNLFMGYTNTNKILLLERTSSRVFEQLQDTLGSMDELLPILVSRNSDEIITDLKSWKDNVLNTSTHLNYYNQTELPEISNRTPTFEYVTSNLNNLLDIDLEVPDCSGISLQVVVSKHKITWKIVFDEKEFSKEWIDEINQVLSNSITSFIEIKNHENDKLLYTKHKNEIIEKTNKPLFFWKSFKKQSEAKPNVTAIHSEDSNLTYNQLFKKVEETSAVLYEKGIIEGQKVVLDSLRYKENIILILSILRNGASFIPVDLGQGESRVALILEEVKPNLIISKITQKNKIYSTVGFDEIINNYKTQPIPEEYKNDFVAYILFTSGSTGTPKGCPIKMSGLSNYLAWTSKNYILNSNDGNFGWFTPMSFDLTLTSIFLPLYIGKSVTVFEDELSTELCLKQYITNDNNCCSIKLTPAHITLLDNLELKNTNIKNVIVGGDLLKEKHIEILQQRIPNARIFNEYGPTEATIGCIVEEIKDKKNISIGLPIEGMFAFVGDQNANELPLGMLGEIYLSGKGLTTGYWNKKKLNYKYFVKDSNNRVWYKTGDLGFKSINNKFNIVGRIDSQIKIRGYRVELSEITTFIEQNKKNIECKILLLGKEENIRIVACLQTDNHHILEEVKSSVANHFPEYMHPADYFVIKKFPINKNGKFDKKALEEIYKKNKDRENTTPIGNEEKLISELWEEIFERKDISVLSDFFEEGGHSLNATKLVALIRKKFLVTFSLKDIYTATTIREQAKLVKQRNQSDLLVKVSSKDAYELTPTQKLFWLSEQKHKKGQYTMPSVFKIKGELNIDAFQKAIQYTIKKHEILSTKVVVVNGEPKLKSNKSLDFKLTVIREKDEKSTLEKLSFENATYKFDIETEPLFRVKIYQVNKNKNYLFINFHHLIFDGWSENVLLDELTYFYSKINNNQKPELTTLVWQSKDFSYWINAKKSAIDYKQQRSFWAKEVTNYSGFVSFPIYQEIKNEYENQGTSIEFLIDDKNLIIALEKISKNIGSTLFTVWLCLFKILLYNYTGVKKWNIGVPFANRDLPELSNQIGCYLQILPILSSIDEDKSFINQIKEEQIKFQKVVANGDYSYQDILNLASQYLPNKQNNDLYSIMLTWLEDETETNWQDLEIEKLDNKVIDSKLDLVLSVRKQKEKIAVEYDYKKALYNEDFIEDFHAHFVKLLEFVALNPEQQIKTFTLLNQEELLKLNTLEKGEEVPISNKILIEEWQKAVQLNKNAVCIVGKTNFSYSQVDKIANQCAITLLNYNTPLSGETVAVELTSGYKQVTWLLGVLKVGAVYLPIDANWPEERKLYVLEKSKSKFLITEKNWDSQPSIIQINKIEAKESNLLKQTVNNNAKDIAYTIFTSGSTGKPKGVRVRHEAFLNMIKAQINVFNMDKNDVVMPMASTAFDASLSEYFMALFSGASLCFPSESEKNNSSKLKTVIEKNKVTTITLTPSVLRVFKDSIVSIKKLICAGEALFKEDIESLQPNITIYNAYGPTEAAVCASIFKVDKNFKENAIPIGKPVDNLSLSIRLPNTKRVLNGAIGELYIGGWPISSYYIDPLEKGLNPYIELEENGIKTSYYKTGDLVKRDRNGDLIYKGRIDNQVQIGGRRVELSEIKKSIFTIDASIEEALVHYYKENNNAFLIAWIINAEKTNETFIKTELSKILPDYMVPSHIIKIDKVPVTSNGKTNFKLLLDQFFNKKQFDNIPITAKHKQMIAVWKTLLVDSNIHDKSNFFSEGGNSLLAIQLIGKVKENFNKNIAIKTVYEHPVLENLAKHINKQEKEKTSSFKADNNEFYIASEAQKRFWALSKINATPKLLNMPTAFLINGSLNKKKFIYSINALLKNNIIFRTIFEFKEGELFTKFTNTAPEVETDFSKKTVVAELYQKLINQEFSLEKGTLVKVYFYKIDENEYFFGLNINHLIADAWTIHLFLSEIFKCYTNLLQDEHYELKKPTIEYNQYLKSVENQKKNKKTLKSAKFWEDKLLGITSGNMTGLSKENSSKIIESAEGKLRFVWQKELFQLNKIKQKGFSTFQYWMVLVNITHYAISKQNQLAMITPVSGRNEAEFSNTLGLFMNMNPLVSTINDQQTVESYFKTIKKEVTEAKTHESYPYTKMLKTKSSKENKALEEFIKVELQVNEFSNLKKQVKIPDNLSIKPFNLENDFMTRKYPLEFHFNQLENEWEFYVLWDENSYDEIKVKKFLQQLILMASCLQENPFTQKIEDLVVLFEQKWKELNLKDQKNNQQKKVNSFINTKF